MPLRRSLLWSVTAALAGVVLLLIATRWTVPATLSGPVGDSEWTRRTRAWFTPRGFQGFELDPDSGRQFSWTGPRARLFFPHLDRSRPYRLTLDINAFRPAGVPEPAVAISVDNVIQTTVQTTIRQQRVTVDLPVRATAGSVVAFASETFIPAGDARALGVMVNDVQLESLDGHFGPDAGVMVWTAVAIGAFVAGILWCGVPALLALPLSIATIGVVVGLLLLDASFLGDDVLRIARIGLSVAAIGAAVAAVRSRWPVVAGLPEWSVAVGLVLGLSALKLACFTHPQIALTDALFQVHRAELVHRGEYFFTSVTPSPSFEFPYAILLYLTALPFWSWFPSELELANLLRGLALAADALVGLTLYAVARRHWGRAPVALCCAALWPLTRAPAMALGHANLTNLFGQGLFGVAMGFIVWMAAGRRWPAAIAGTIVLTLAFLSHFSTLTVGILLVSFVGASCVAFGPNALRRTGLVACAMLLTAVALAYGLYYSHFNELYLRTFTRVVSGQDQQSDTSMVASPLVKWQRWVSEDQFSNDYGLPGVALFVSAVVGAAWLLWTRPRDAMTRVLISWAVVWAAASAIGILTSVELRANLAATPMFVCLAAYALAGLASRSMWGRVVAAVVVCAIAWNGAHVWLMWLGKA